ncbi:MAG: 3-hydroxyacyl-CoA dehydrogenase/enoyl-CoA hydratase family protein [Saprospiraceae bacterium]
MSRRISKVAVIGSGIMGAGIAAHCANIGLDVLMLDIVPFDLTEEEKAKPAARNRIVNASLKQLTKSKPAAMYEKSVINRIKVGNLDDDLHLIKNCDWVVEVIVERLDIKQQLFEKIEKYRKPGSLITSNTSSIPIHLMAEGRSEDFKKHFCGTHFFNPPRYLRLLEIIPTADTSQEVVDFFMEYGDVYLGKQTVLCKDTPGFIANRIGVYTMLKVIELAEELGLNAETVDQLTGPASGRPKTGTFRLSDLVGLDTTIKVMEVIKENCPDDQDAQNLKVPVFVQHLLDNKWYGGKSGQGFYQKTKVNGKKTVLTLDFKTLEYRASEKPNIPSLKKTKQIDNLAKRVKFLFNAEDVGGEFTRKASAALFSYSALRVPEITDHLFSLDHAITSGFAWKVGPFETWDAVGLEEGIKVIEAEGYAVADWVKEMQAAGHTSFYKLENGVKQYYNIESKSYQPIPGADEFIILDNHRAKAPVYKNAEVVLHDIGDDVLCLEFRSKMNSIGAGVLEGVNKAIDIAESGEWRGLVIGNNAERFTVGANLMMIGMYAFQGEWDEMNFAVKTFQDTVMRLRYSNIPVVLSVQGMALGGGCEMIMHSDSALVASESYIGLVEVGVGLIPGGAGTKEFAVRASDSFRDGDVMVNTLIDRFTTIAMAKVATSAREAYNYGYLTTKKDRTVMNQQRNIGEAKKEVLRLSGNYTQPVMRTDVQVLGRSGLGALYAAASSFKFGNYISDHDVKIAKKVAWVMCGGDLTAPQKVSERYLLDLEREAFLSLAGEQKTQERIQHMLTKNKPLRN